VSAETPGTDQDDIEALNRRLAGVVQQALRDGETDMNAGDCNRAGWHVAEAVLASDWLAAYIARKVEAVESERDEAVAAAECNHLAKIEWFERAETAERERDEARAMIERVTALAASLRRPLGGSGPFGAGSPEQRGCDYAADRLDTTIARATHVHQCASAGYPDHEPSSSCLCVCGERFDGKHTEPTVPASDRPLTLDEHLAEVRAWHHKAYNSTSDEVWERNPVCASDGHGWPCDVEIVGRGVDQVVDAALVEVERRIKADPMMARNGYAKCLKIVRAYREEVRRG
jgi:hypothetical protein